MKRFLGKWIPGWPLFSRGNDLETADPLAREVVRLYEQGRYREARDVAVRLVDLQRRNLGEQHPDFAAALSNLALLHQQLGQLLEAEPLLRQALEVRRESFGEHDPQFAASLNHLADLFQRRGDLPAAEPLLRQALEVRKHSLGEHHPEYAAGLTGLALLLGRQGDYENAEPLLVQALAIREETLGRHHPMTATAVSNLGLILQRRGDLAAAEPLLRRALELRREALGVQHPDYAASLSHLAMLMIAQDNRSAAEPLLSRAINVRKAILGAQNPDVLADQLALDSLRQVHDTKSPEATRVLLIPPRVAAEPDLDPEPVPEAVPALPASFPEIKAVVASVADVIPGPSSDPSDEVSDPPKVSSPPSTETVNSSASLRPAGEIAAELRALEVRFSKVGEALIAAGETMRTAGLPPSPMVLEDASGCRTSFDILLAQSLASMEVLGLSPPRCAPGIAALASLMDRAAKEERERPRRRLLLQNAATLLDRSLRLRHIDPAQTPLPAIFLESAEALRRKVQNASAAEEIAPEIRKLAEGAHPIAAILRLAGAAADMPDADWAKLYREVATAYGKSLAAAAARKRLGLAPANPVNKATASSPATIAPKGPLSVPGPASRTHEAVDLKLNRMHRPVLIRLDSGFSREVELPGRDG